MNYRSEIISLLKIYFIIAAGLLVFSISYTGCSEEETNTPPPPSDQNAVSIINFTFNPTTRNVTAGTTITWTNNDNIDHTVTSGTPQNPTPNNFDSGNIPPGGTFQHTFTDAGNFAYYCTLHPSMTAQIAVQ